MKKNKLAIFTFLTVVIAVVLTLCFKVIIPKFEMESSSSSGSVSSVDRNYENSDDFNINIEFGGSTNQPDTGENSKPATPTKNDLEFFVNSSSITKCKEISGQTTMFNISFRVFVTNNTGETKTILTNGFSSDYNTNGNGLFFKFDCSENPSFKELKTNEAADFVFTLTYVITNPTEFNITNTHNLKVNYMQSEIISVFV